MPSERKRSETVDTVAKAILLSATEKVPISDTMRACGLKGDLTVVRNIYPAPYSDDKTYLRYHVRGEVRIQQDRKIGHQAGPEKQTPQNTANHASDSVVIDLTVGIRCTPEGVLMQMKPFPSMYLSYGGYGGRFSYETGMRRKSADPEIGSSVFDILHDELPRLMRRETSEPVNITAIVHEVRGAAIDLTSGKITQNFGTGPSVLEFILNVGSLSSLARRSSISGVALITFSEADTFIHVAVTGSRTFEDITVKSVSGTLDSIKLFWPGAVKD